MWYIRFPDGILHVMKHFRYIFLLFVFFFFEDSLSKEFTQKKAFCLISELIDILKKEERDDLPFHLLLHFMPIADLWSANRNWNSQRNKRISSLSGECTALHYNSCNNKKLVKCHFRSGIGNELILFWWLYLITQCMALDERANGNLSG